MKISTDRIQKACTCKIWTRTRTRTRLRSQPLLWIIFNCIATNQLYPWYHVPKNQQNIENPRTLPPTNITYRYPFVCCRYCRKFFHRTYRYPLVCCRYCRKFLIISSFSPEALSKTIIVITHDVFMNESAGNIFITGNCYSNEHCGQMSWLYHIDTFVQFVVGQWENPGIQTASHFYSVCERKILSFNIDKFWKKDRFILCYFFWSETCDK